VIVLRKKKKKKLNKFQVKQQNTNNILNVLYSITIPKFDFSDELVNSGDLLEDF